MNTNRFKLRLIWQRISSRLSSFIDTLWIWFSQRETNDREWTKRFGNVHYEACKMTRWIGRPCGNFTRLNRPIQQMEMRETLCEFEKKRLLAVKSTTALPTWHQSDGPTIPNKSLFPPLRVMPKLHQARFWMHSLSHWIISSFARL